MEIILTKNGHGYDLFINGTKRGTEISMAKALEIIEAEQRYEFEYKEKLA